MVDIVISQIPPVQNDPNRRNPQQQAPRDGKRPPERRKNKRDRRRSVRDGVVVTLSHIEERRQQPDRRKKG